ncbi:tetratricopeptide repeat protein [Parabacteroides sp. AGMB00274]|uniref:Tetratricopeptide repeat protein n=1 Tax=Parabacteroides faecalis TaxID=2924040 RepID=A0ABT0C4K0_9BACT|nr:tetratricopeptide repeat protein [Parabacteroides faecalis]MCJ2381934.1 tetratricopeptide repeat protein [Parabacteroides faecalis]
MRIFLALLVIALGWIMQGCTNEADRNAIRQMEQAAPLMQSDPEVAHVLLADSVAHPELLSPEVNARWCLMLCQLADSIGTPLPYVPQMERTYRYMKRHGTIDEQLQAALYLGRTYMDDQDQEAALRTYTEALQQSIMENKPNQSGYISSYMGDVYQFQGMYQQAVEKYLTASRYFQQVGNHRSEGIAFIDASRNYTFMDSLDIALKYMLRADSMVVLYGDSVDRACILNGLGNIYKTRGNEILAKKYLQKAIKYDLEESAPSYLALAKLELSKQNYEQARLYLKQAERPTINKGTAIELPYQYYLIEKQIGNTTKALAELENFITVSDSILWLRNNAEINGLEDKYKYSLLLSDNAQLRTVKTRRTAFLAIVVLLTLYLYFHYKARLERKNKCIYQQALILEQKNNTLLTLKNDLQQKQLELKLLSRQMSQQKVEWQALYEKKVAEIHQKEEEISLQTRSIWEVSPITKRLQTLVRKVNPNATQPPLTDKDWNAIREQVRTLYPAVEKVILTIGLKGSEEKLCYLSLFKFDTNQEAILLNVAINSVNTYRRNIRKKLQIQNPSQKLCDFLLELK